MANFYSLQQQTENRAELIVMKSLRDYLPDECFVYYGATLHHKGSERRPDFIVICPQRNVLVLEVKGWMWNSIQEVGKDGVLIQGKWHQSPVEQARTASLTLNNMLASHEELIDPITGKRLFSYAYAGVLPFIGENTRQFAGMEKRWGQGHLLGAENLAPNKIWKKIAGLPPHPKHVLTERQINVIRGIVNPKNIVFDNAGDVIGTLDPIQESIVIEPIRLAPAKGENFVRQENLLDMLPEPANYAKSLEKELPDDAKRLAEHPLSTQHIRLIRGVAGTGKSIVLRLRVRHVHELLPDVNILVTTYNKPIAEEIRNDLKDLAPKVEVKTFDSLCTNIYKTHHGIWPKPQDMRGIVSILVRTNSVARFYGEEFLVQEFTWMKETGMTSRESYVTGIRKGRGKTSRRLGARQKAEIFDLFETYQNRLQALPAIDWIDLHEQTLNFMQNGTEPDKRYDYIFIDEAQHFAPTWMRIIEGHLKANGNLFLSDDPSQSVYRAFSWRQKGIEVRGRTRWLRIPYRNTLPIFTAAYALVEENPDVKKLLEDDGESVVPDPENHFMPDGPSPELHKFANLQEEKTFVKKKIAELIQSGVKPNEIAILHEKKHVREKYQELQSLGVRVLETKRQTGLEYRVVFIPRLQEFNGIPSASEDYYANQQRTLYVAMTRARRQLYILYENKWPNKIADPILPYVTQFSHN